MIFGPVTYWPGANLVRSLSPANQDFASAPYRSMIPGGDASIGRTAECGQFQYNPDGGGEVWVRKLLYAVPHALGRRRGVTLALGPELALAPPIG